MPRILPSSGLEVEQADLSYIIERLSSELSALAGKRLLLTGGAGFLGYYLTQIVLHWNSTHSSAERIKLTVLDNFLLGVPKWMNEWEGSSSLRLFRHDIASPLPSDLGNFDYIIHAASIASPSFYRKHPLACIDANVGGLRNLLDHCVRQTETGQAVEGFLFFSSSEIYGDPPPEQIPTRETYRGNVSCTGPRACYDEAKRFGETLCVSFSSQYHLPVKVVRPFNNYGPGLRITDGRVVPDFARNILRGEDIVIRSDGNPMRTFCYVADAVVGYYKALVRGEAADAYNIGVEEPEISIAELAQLMIGIARDLFHYTGQVIFLPSEDQNYLVDNPARRCPSIAKAKAELDYEPAVSLEEGLRRTMLWYRGVGDAEGAV